MGEDADDDDDDEDNGEKPFDAAPAGSVVFSVASIAASRSPTPWAEQASNGDVP